MSRTPGTCSTTCGSKVCSIFTRNRPGISGSIRWRRSETSHVLFLHNWVWPLQARRAAASIWSRTTFLHWRIKARSLWQSMCESLWPEGNLLTGMPYHHLPGSLLCFRKFWRSQRKDEGLCKVDYPSLLSILQSLHTEYWNSERHQKYWECGAGSPQRFEHSVWCFEQNEPVSGDLMPGPGVSPAWSFWGLAVNVM